jgi:hypothetical protein
MIMIKQTKKRKSIQQEIRQIEKAAQKIGASKSSARRFLISTGVYTDAGELKPTFR